MTERPAAGTQARPPTIPLSEAENRRAVDLIERAERRHPFCACGAANGAVARGQTIWLECSRLSEPRHGFRASLARYAAGVGHTRHAIVELSSSTTAPVSEPLPAMSDHPGQTDTRPITASAWDGFDPIESGMLRFMATGRLTASTAPIWRERAGISWLVETEPDETAPERHLTAA